MKSPSEQLQARLRRYGPQKASAKANKYFLKEYNVFSKKKKHRSLTNGREFSPGTIYTFFYDSPLSQGAPSRDLWPIFLAVDTIIAEGTGNRLHRGINLNYLPPGIRNGLLALLFDYYPPGLLERLNNDPEYPSQAITEGGFHEIYALFDQKPLSSFKCAIRSYLPEEIRNPLVIDFEDWEIIPLIQPLLFENQTVDEVIRRFEAYDQTH